LEQKASKHSANKKAALPHATLTMSLSAVRLSFGESKTRDFPSLPHGRFGFTVMTDSVCEDLTRLSSRWRLLRRVYLSAHKNMFFLGKQLSKLVGHCCFNKLLRLESWQSEPVKEKAEALPPLPEQAILYGRSGLDAG